jgi:tetratricopeptide (TPR) repeat protein
MQNIRLTAFIAALTLLAIPLAQANPIDDCNQSDDPEKQIDGCTEFLQLDPFSPYVALAYGRRGEAYMRKGDLSHAIADFDQAVAIDGRQARLYVGRGLAYRDKGDLDHAIGDFSKAIELDSKFGEAFINRCVVYEDKGQADLAIADCTAAIAINPKDAVAYNDRGVAREKAGKIEDAIADYSTAIELDAGYRDAYANRAVLYDHSAPAHFSRSFPPANHWLSARNITLLHTPERSCITLPNYGKHPGNVT